MITDGTDKWHYIAIRSIPALLRGVTSTHNGDYYCFNSFHLYRIAKKLEEHEQLRVKNNYGLIKIPTEKNKYITSTPGKNTLKNPFIIYADLECLLYLISTCDNTEDSSFTIRKNIHKPSGYSLLTSYAYDKSLNEYIFYRGKDGMRKLSEPLKRQVNKIINIKQKPIDLLTEQEKILHENAKICFICKKSFNDDKKVRDHCHYTGKYRGAAHNACNLQYKVPKSIPVVSHNGSNYGFHLIIKQLAKNFNGLFSCLGENTEKYITFSICIFKKTCYNEKPIAYQIKFIDSYRHMDKSLSILVDNLIKESYYSELNDESISDSDLVHVKNICDAFNITNLGDYHDLYVSLDVALLADVFEHFRGTTINIDKLDPAYYLSAPALSWHSCMKKTGVKLELLTDENMLLLFEKGIRGGMCNVIHKYARANNKYMKEYDITKESIFLAYLDESNLYGWAMSKKLPVDNFKWETDLSIFTMDFIKNYNKESDTGYLLYVNVEYPKNLRKSHEDLPFLSNRMNVNKVNKIICNQYDKHKYSVHIYALNRL